MSDVSDNLSNIESAISNACSRAGRARESVQLIAVSKTFPVDLVREAFEAGQFHFGESRLQEAEPKIDALPGTLHWQYIGRVQRNKVRRLLQKFEVIHAIDSLRLATCVDEIAKELGLFPKVFLQVNLGDEASKGGFAPDELHREMEALLKLERLEIVGLMCIPPVGPDGESARPWFIALRNLRGELEIEFRVKLPALSMGMSGDFDIAIEEGATHVRVGSAIFGTRSYQADDGFTTPGSLP